MHAYKVRPIRYAHGFCWALFCCDYITVFNLLIISIYLYSLVLLHCHWRSRMIVTSQITRFMGPTWDPPGSCRPQVGPMLVSWTLLSGTLWTWVNSTSNQPQQHNKVQNVCLTLGTYCTNNMYIYIHILYMYMYAHIHIIYDDFGARSRYQGQGLSVECDYLFLPQIPASGITMGKHPAEYKNMLNHKNMSERLKYAFRKLEPYTKDPMS